MASGSASCGTNYFCVGAFLIFVGSVLLCALGFTVLLPHVATRKWPEVTCEVMNTSYNFMQCMCDQQIYAEDLGCVIKYPCLEVMIRYNVSRSALRNTTGLSMAKYELLDRDATQTFHYTDKHVTNRTHSHLSEGLPQELPREKFGVEHKQPEANTIDKLEEGSVSNPDAPKTEVDSSVGNPDASKTEVDSSRGHVDPRSTLPYSGSAMTSDANLATAKMENGARDDVVWVSTTLFRWWSDAFYGKCSIHECGVEEWNIKAAAQFRSSWGMIGQSYRCFYKPDSPNVVILEKTQTSSVMHAIFWPCLSLTSGWLLWLGLCVGCCTIDNGDDNLIDH